MSTAVAEPDTLADVVRALGDIPLRRILWDPLPGTATEEHLRRSRHAELVDGMLVRKSLGMRKGLTEVVVAARLLNYVRPARLGAVTIASGPYRLGPGVVRLPDVAFIQWPRLLDDTGQVPEIASGAPDLAVEVPTPDNSRAEMDRKRREHFAAGTKLVWIIDPDARTVEVYADPQRPDLMTLLRETDTLDGGTVLPGFTLPLADLFNDPQLNPRP